MGHILLHMFWKSWNIDYNIDLESNILNSV